MSAHRIVLAAIIILDLAAATCGNQAEPPQNLRRDDMNQTQTVEFFIYIHQSGNIIRVAVDRSGLVADVKEQIYLAQNVSTESQVLQFNGTTLENDRSLASLNIPDGAQLALAVCQAPPCAEKDLFQGPLACRESDSLKCHSLAYCEDYGSGGVCVCPEGGVGDGVRRENGGMGCNRHSWAVRVTLDLVDPFVTDGGRLDRWEAERSAFTDLFFADPTLEKPSWFDTSVYHSIVESRYVTIAALFETQQAAIGGMQAFEKNAFADPPMTVFGIDLVSDALMSKPGVYTFVLPTSDAALQIQPTGMDIQKVYFKRNCLQSGCWVVDLIYTIGKDTVNVFYLPKAIGDNDLSYDFDYSVVPDYAQRYGHSPLDTFLSSTFPCGSDGHKYQSSSHSDIADRVSACCIEEFAQLYRPTESFVSDPRVAAVLGTSRDRFCSVNATRKIWNSTYHPDSALFGNFSDMDGLAFVEFKGVEDPFSGQHSATVYLDEAALRRKAGVLAGTVGVAHTIDTFIGFANFRPTGLEFLDSFAAQSHIHLEHNNFLTVAAYGHNSPITFLEYVNLRLVSVLEEYDPAVPSLDQFDFDDYHLTTRFNPYPASAATGSATLGDDSQVWLTPNADGSYTVHYYLTGLPAGETQGGMGIHAGTTCATHEQVLGHFFLSAENPWTQVMWSKAVGETVSFGAVTVQSPGFALSLNEYHAFVVREQSGDRIACGVLTNIDPERTSRLDAAHYLQLTFTLGEQYQPIETGVVPIDSVVVSKGDFVTSSSTLATRFHPCRQYLDRTLPDVDLFDSRFPTADSQTCAPNATMCSNPSYIPDQFVHFNIPVGIDWFPAPSNSLDSNIFVDFVVSVIDAKQIAVPNAFPNSGDAAEQVKTSLTVSIPVVEGGVYLFCDSIVGALDLVDVANADLIFGTAALEAEFSRLRIVRNLASRAGSALENANSTAHNIDTDSIEAGLMTLVIKGNSSHFQSSITTSSSSLELEDVITVHVLEPEDGSKYEQLLALLRAPGDDDASSSGDGFALNGAFRLTIDRDADRASLQPTPALENLCPFSAQRPSPTALFPETCVCRRDVANRMFPAAPGQNVTAMELPAAGVPLDDPARNAAARFMQSVINPSAYSAALGRNFSHIIAQKYMLNDRYRRAFWINPGYEWSPQQTGRQTLFTLSQNLVLVALINLDEGFFGRRRMLLQSSDPTEDTGAGVAAEKIRYSTSLESLMASMFDIPAALIATFDVEMQLTFEQACMEEDELRRSLTSILDAHLYATTTGVETVQVANIVFDRGDVQCSNRRLGLARRLLQDFSPATAIIEMVVAFSPSTSESDPVAFDIQRFVNFEGINSVRPVTLSGEVQLAEVSDPPPRTTGILTTPSGEPAEPPPNRPIIYTPSPKDSNPEPPSDPDEDGSDGPGPVHQPRTTPPPTPQDAPQTTPGPTQSADAVEYPAAEVVPEPISFHAVLVTAFCCTAFIAAAGAYAYKNRTMEACVISTFRLDDLRSELVNPDTPSAPSSGSSRPLYY